MKKYAIGIDVGGTNISVGLFDGSREPVQSLQSLTDKELEADQLMDHLAAQVRQLVDVAGLSMSDVRGVGAAFPSYIDFKTGVVVARNTWGACSIRSIRSSTSTSSSTAAA